MQMEDRSVSRGVTHWRGSPSTIFLPRISLESMWMLDDHILRPQALLACSAQSQTLPDKRWAALVGRIRTRLFGEERADRWIPATIHRRFAASAARRLRPVSNVSHFVNGLTKSVYIVHVFQLLHSHLSDTGGLQSIEPNIIRMRCVEPRCCPSRRSLRPTMSEELVVSIFSQIEIT
jgi:hypothetical protein